MGFDVEDRYQALTLPLSSMDCRIQMRRGNAGEENQGEWFEMGAECQYEIDFDLRCHTRGELWNVLSCKISSRH